MPHSYLDKAGDVAAVRTNAQALLSYLERLNLYDWTDLIQDIILDPYQVGRIFLAGKETDILPTVCTFLDKLGEETKRLIASAAENILRHSLAHPEDPNRSEMIPLILFMASSLSLPLDVVLLSDMVRREDLKAEVRAKAASILGAKYPAQVVDFWLGLDANRTPELIPSVVNALARIDANKAFDLLLPLSSAPLHEGSLEYPLRRVLRNLAADFKLDSVLERSPAWLRQILLRLVEEPEFQSFRPAAPVLQFQDQRASFFDRYIQFVKENDWRLFIKPTGYFQGKLFSGRDIPVCMYQYGEKFMDLLWSRALEAGIAESNERPLIRLEMTRSFSLDSVVDDILEGKVMQSEVAFSSHKRARRASMVAVGEIASFGILFADKWDSHIRTTLGVRNADSGNRPVSVPDLKTVLEYCVRQSVDCMVQPSTALYEELVTELEQTGEAGSERIFREISELDDIKELLNARAKKAKTPRQIALVDYVIARSIEKSKRLKMYEGKFKPSLHAGFLVPDRDPVTADIITEAIKGSLYKDGRWNLEFSGLMRGAKVSLFSDGPRLVHLADDTGERPVVERGEFDSQQTTKVVVPIRKRR